MEAPAPDETGLVTLISIDPGLTGGIAHFDAAGTPIEVYDMPVLKTGAKGKNEIDVNGVIDLMPTGASVVIEAQQAMQKQGLASTFKTGKGYGALLGLLDALAFPYRIVQPRAWSKIVGKPAGTGKEWNIGEARRRWPQFTKVLLKSKDGRADALLIGAAEFKQPDPAPKVEEKKAVDVAMPDW